MKTLSVLLGTFCLLNFTTSACYSQLQGGAGQPNADAVRAAQEETEELYIVLKPGVDPQTFAQENGMVLVKSSPALTGRNSHVFAAENAEGARSKLLEVSARVNTVRKAHLNEKSFEVADDEPNDPFFRFASSFGGQWTLDEEIPVSPIGTDISMLGAWSQGYWGEGIVIGVLDDAVQVGHPDLAPAALSGLHYDYKGDDNDPSPVPNAIRDESHGTSVAGVAAARANNGIGIAGVAGQASLAGIRALGTQAFGTTTQKMADGIVHGSTSIDVKNHSWGRAAPFGLAIAFNDAFQEPNGQIHVKSAGNNRNNSNFAAQDSGKDMTDTAGSNIVVGAIGDDAKFARYSCFGSVLMCSAPSSGGPHGFRVTATDLVGADGTNDGSGGDYVDRDYTSQFGGTSAAAPQVAGVLALVREVNPFFDRHNMGHLIVRSCDIVDANDSTWESDGGWRANGAGFAYNQNYGYGMINAAKIVSVAQQYAGGTAGFGFSTNTNGWVTVNSAIPDSGSLTRTFSFPPGRRGQMTQLVLNMGINHARRGDLSCYITSPSGFRSRLFTEEPGDDGSNISSEFRFRSVAFWGEDYEGTWEIELIDNRAGITGTLTGFQANTHLSELLEIDLPDNDELADAFELASSATGSNSRGTTEPFESDIENFDGSGGDARRSVWWKGIATVDGMLSVNTFGSDFDTVLHVYRIACSPVHGCSRYQTEDLELIDWNDDSGGFQSSVSTPVIAGEEVLIRVSGFNGAMGDIQIAADGLGSNVTVDGNDLEVRGNNEDNIIVVTEVANTTFVEVDGFVESIPGVYNVTVTAYDGNDTITANVPGIRIGGGDGDDNILFFGSEDSLLLGGNGNDTIRGGSGPDFISGQAGDDLLIGRAGNDNLSGGSGVDEIRGISGRNIISGGSEDDEIFGGTGPDVIRGGTGDDTIYGGSGADEIHGDEGLNFIDGGVASDVIFGGNSQDIINGGPGNDRIAGYGGDDLIDGGTGSDEIFGGTGNDVITGGLGLDRLFGGDGNDTLIGAESSDFLSGGNGNDELDGGTGPDELFGGAGDDQLTGGDGFDALHGGPGNDTATDTGEAAETGIEN